MKTFFYSAFIIFCFNHSIHAQSKIEDAANFAADYLCSCVNEIYAEVEPEIREFIFKIYTLPEHEQSNFIMSLSPDQQQRIITQAAIMGSEAKAAEMDECNNNMTADIERKFSDLESDKDFYENEMMDMIINRLSKKSRCEFAYFLLKAGLESQN